MAKFLHRKLFPYLASSPTNETAPCTDFCDPTCSNFEDCYTFPNPAGPLPPLPPPLPPTTVVVSSSATNQGVQISPLVIVAVIVLASVFLLVSYYAFVIKYCSFWTGLITRQNNDIDPLHQPDNIGDSHAIDALIHELDEHDPVVDHPIWLISTIGLHQSVINAITVVRYKKEEGWIDGTDCSVCLSEFQEGETLRLLPKCKHAFHIDCIDTWLRSHTNCPLCRASIVLNSGRPSLASNEPSFGHSRRTEFTQMVDSDSSDLELGSNRTDNSSVVVGNRGGDVDNDQNKAEIDMNTLVRRSFSMDFFRGSSTRNVGGPHLARNNSNSSSFQVVDSSSSSRPQPPRAARIKRSYSWSERVFWSTRNQNDHSRDISP